MNDADSRVSIVTYLPLKRYNINNNNYHNSYFHTVVVNTHFTYRDRDIVPAACKSLQISITYYIGTYSGLNALMPFKVYGYII